MPIDDESTDCRRVVVTGPSTRVETESKRNARDTVADVISHCNDAGGVVTI
ncbi:hypothetical protein [Natrinema sp. DC36]|uniref:hypothetical protein n=1 Tax=Natrinema sp. DC36 TaxID=2878680 RepID=UPI001CF06022|nr:hypothetical protein [Natrinema sp. DC36]